MRKPAALDFEDLNRPKGIQRSQRLPDPALGALWDSIIIDEVVKSQLLSQAVLNFTVRGKVERSVLPLHGVILLVGLPGTGKTSLARGLAHRTADSFSSAGFRLLEVEPHTLTSSAMGKTQRAVSELFSQAIAETASTVTIRYPGGAAKVDKKLLPENLQAVYKIDPAAGAAEAKADAEQKAIYDAQVRATEEKQKEEHDALVASVAAKSQQDSKAQKAAVESDRRAHAEQIASIKKEAKKYADHYFRYDYLGGVSGAIVERLDVDLREPKEVSGWPGRYAVDGNASLEYFASAGFSFQKSA